MALLQFTWINYEAVALTLCECRFCVQHHVWNCITNLGRVIATCKLSFKFCNNNCEDSCQLTTLPTKGCEVLQSKVDNPHSVTFLIEVPIFEWYMIWCGSKNGYQKDTCSKEIGLLAQNMINVLNSLGQQHWETCSRSAHSRSRSHWHSIGYRNFNKVGIEFWSSWNQ